MGEQGAGRGRRRGRQLRRAVARHLQEADRPRQPAGRRDRHRRRRDRAVAAARLQRIDARCPRTAPSCCFARCAGGAAARRRGGSRRRADLQLQRRHEGADRRGGARRRAQRRRRLRRDARLHRLRLVQAGSRRRSSSSRARGWPSPTCSPRSRPSRRRAARAGRGVRRRRHAQQDRALQDARRTASTSCRRCRGWRRTGGRRSTTAIASG